MQRLDRFLIIIWSLRDKEIYVVINKIDSEKIFRPASVNIPPVLVSLSVATFSQGAVNTSIQASFQSNCCHPKVVFVGLDLVGNMGTCSVSLVPDIVAFGAKPNATAVSLRSEETTKVPFTLTNLGSRGSFSFHVTKSASFISYVIPFSLALDVNASAAGHVVIASRIDINQHEKLTVTAVAQSDTVNNKEVTLFDIQVSVLSETQPTTPAETQHTTPALKQIRLEAVAPKSHQSIEQGARLELNFSVTNLAAVETFTFYVRFLPRMVFLLSFLLDLTMKLFMYLSPGEFSYTKKAGVLPLTGTKYLICGRDFNLSSLSVTNSYKTHYFVSYVGKYVNNNFIFRAQYAKEEPKLLKGTRALRSFYMRIHPPPPRLKWPSSIKM